MELIAKTLVKVHSSENLNQEERRGREVTSARYRSIIQEDDGQDGNVINSLFTIAEL